MNKVLLIVGGVVVVVAIGFGVYMLVGKEDVVMTVDQTPSDANVAEIMKNTPPVVIEATPDSEKVVPTLQVPVVEEREVVPEKVEDTHVKSTATVFAEFYGSFDSGTVLRSIEPLSQMTTRDYYARLVTQAQNARGDAPYTMQTRSLGAKILEGNKIEVLTRRVKTTAGVSENFQQKIVVTLQKVGDTYLVSDATWNPTTF